MFGTLRVPAQLAGLAMVAGFACTSEQSPADSADKGAGSVVMEFVGHVDSKTGKVDVVPRDRAAELGEEALGLLRELPVVQDGVPASSPPGTIEVRTDWSAVNNPFACEGHAVAICGGVTFQSFLVGSNILDFAVQLTVLSPSAGRAALNSDPFDGPYLARYGARPGSSLGFWKYPDPTIRPGESTTRTWVLDNSAGGDFYFTGRGLGETVPTSCPTGDLGSTLGAAIASGTTVGAPDSFDESCGLEGGSDVSFTWTAPADGRYSFDTFGSDFDTVLAVQNGACNPSSELACNDQTDGDQSRVRVDLTAGQRITIVIDGWGAAAAGNYVLNASELSAPRCPDLDLGSAVGPSVATGSFIDAPDSFDAACLAPDTADASFTWTAPSNNFFRVDAVDDAAGALPVYVIEGACTGGEVLCNTASGTFQAIQGQVYTLVTSGSNSGFSISITDAGAPICPDANLGSSTGSSVASGSSVGAQPTFEGTCATSLAGDVAFTWTAPTSGTYNFDTIGSTFDTVLYVFDTVCDESTEIACNDDSSGTQSRVTVDVTAGHAYTIVVDGFNTSEGDYQLNIAEVVTPVCPNGDLGSALGASVASGSTVGGSSFFAQSCTAPGSDVSYTWTAPRNGTFDFTVGSPFTVAVFNGNCAGPELACANAARVTLTSGQRVTIAVSGGSFEGSFTLGINELVVADCPTGDLGSAIGAGVASGSTAGVTDGFRASTCAFSAVSGGEATYTWTAPNNGVFTFDTFGSAFDTVLYVLNGSCTGAEIACNDQSGGDQSLVQLTVTAGQTVTLIIDGWNGESGSYVLNVAEVATPTCPLADLGSALGNGVASGTTVDGIGSFNGTCASSGASDVVYLWTAPAAGRYTFDLSGSNYDTVLYLLGAECGGAELVCNDDSSGLTSSVSLTMTAGQLVSIVVDGFAAAEGNYVLDINAS
ncbi:MAG: hypothetical protein HYV07_34165 [Deltaproteobacteria bacterium]|nr:hypothetical protein [Deltaproteobacteria bacterium]